jgi:hypothetical protein
MDGRGDHRILYALVVGHEEVFLKEKDVQELVIKDMQR